MKSQDIKDKITDEKVEYYCLKIEKCFYENILDLKEIIESYYDIRRKTDFKFTLEVNISIDNKSIPFWKAIVNTNKLSLIKPMLELKLGDKYAIDHRTVQYHIAEQASAEVIKWFIEANSDKSISTKFFPMIIRNNSFEVMILLAAELRGI